MQFRKKPSEYQFALGAVIAGTALMLALIIRVLEESFSCTPVPGVLKCYDAPPMAYEVLFVIAAIALCHSLYRYYRDFHRGEYQQRCARRGY